MTLVPRPTGAFRVRGAPDGARAPRPLCTHQSGLGTFSVPDVQRPGTEFRAAVLRTLTLLTASIALACEPATNTEQFVEPETKRAYRVILRRDHDARRAAPVLFALHAYSTAPDVLVDSYSLQGRAAKDRGYLVVVPEGQRDREDRYFWNASEACCGVTENPPDDLGYLRNVLADVKRRYAVDAERVYAIGVSNGAFMAHRWACTPGGDLRGIVSISGMAPGTSDPPCAPSVPVRVQQIHGDEDDVILYEGGQGIRGPYPSARRSLEPYLKANQCGKDPVTEREWSIVHGSTEHRVWTGKGANVVLWTFEGGSHHLRSLRFSVDRLLAFLDE